MAAKPAFGGKKAPPFGASSSSSDSESADPKDSASSDDASSSDSASNPLAAWMNKKGGGKK